MEKKWLIPLGIVLLLIAGCYFYMGEKPKQETLAEIGEGEEGEEEAYRGIALSPRVVNDTIYPNETKKYQFTFYNEGNVRENISIGISGLPYKWEAVHPDNETVAPGGRVSFTLSINALGALPETSVELRLNARTFDDNLSACAEIKLHVRALVDQCFNQTRELSPARLPVNQNLSVAQEFIPSLSHLWKVGVNVTSEGAEKMLWICIRKELNGSNLSRKCISPIETTGWVEVHLPATLERGEKYYLVLESDARNGTYYLNVYMHFKEINDPYREGGVWINTGGTWKDISYYMDLEFCTWGYK